MFSVSMLLPHLVPLVLLFNVGGSLEDFIFNGFSGVNLTLDGLAAIEPNGLLRLTNFSGVVKGHAIFPSPLRFRGPAGKPRSFSTAFVAAIVPEAPLNGGHGLAFFVSHTNNFSTAIPTQYLGLLNLTNNGNASNHLLAVELDTILNTEFQDPDYNHVGVDVNSLHSVAANPAGYFVDGTGEFKNFTLIAGDPVQIWVDFDGEGSQLDVTLAPLNINKPWKPLLSVALNLSVLEFDQVYIGFSASTGASISSHYILGWSFKMDGSAKSLDLTKLPRLPKSNSKGNLSKILAISLPLSATALLLLTAAGVMLLVHHRRKYKEVLEEWELEYGPHRFSYKDLYKATKGFKEKELLGIGGFGRVYRGELPLSKMAVAVKKVSHGSKQGMKEFVAEIVSMGRLRHRNLVQLLGYCRRKGELLLVYDYMPNGSLDRFLYDREKQSLNWAQRFWIIKGVASGLLYLHEGWEQVVIHRDVKASNVLLDSEMNGRLGDFGLARLYDHGADPKTTHIFGTPGYLAPELTWTRKATTATDVFAFGSFLLEVACGRRPIEENGQGEEVLVVDWVLKHWREGSILGARDPRLGEEYETGQLELVLKLGLHCSDPLHGARPSMRQVMQYLDGDAPVPDLSSTFSTLKMLELLQRGRGGGGADTTLSYQSSQFSAAILSGPR